MERHGKLAGYECWFARDEELDQLVLILSRIHEDGQRALVTSVEQGPFESLYQVIERLLLIMERDIYEATR